jgi:hypothetical protein
MHNTLELIQLAESVHAERSDRRLGGSTQERSPTLRTRVGQRLIGVGERLAGTRTATAAH